MITSNSRELDGNSRVEKKHCITSRRIPELYLNFPLRFKNVQYIAFRCSTWKVMGTHNLQKKQHSSARHGLPVSLVETLRMAQRYRTGPHRSNVSIGAEERAARGFGCLENQQSQSRTCNDSSPRAARRDSQTYFSQTANLSEGCLRIRTKKIRIYKSICPFMLAQTKASRLRHSIQSQQYN